MLQMFKIKCCFLCPTSAPFERPQQSVFGQLQCTYFGWVAVDGGWVGVVVGGGGGGWGGGGGGKYSLGNKKKHNSSHTITSFFKNEMSANVTLTKKFEIRNLQKHFSSNFKGRFQSNFKAPSNTIF